MATKKTKKDTVDLIENDEELVGSLIADLTSEFGEGTMSLEDSASAQVKCWVPSGTPVLDAKLGGGYPAGRVIELFGPESNGKTTVALHAIAEAQKMGGIGVFLDTEHALDKRRAKSIGVDLKKLIYAQPETMEKLFEYTEKIIQLLKQKAPDKLIVLVWDSVAATATESEVEGDYGDATMGIHARIMSQAFRKITGMIAKHNVLFICINQVRDKIGGVSWGEKTSTFGGRALKFYASQRIEVKRTSTIKAKVDGVEKPVGISCKATVKKNKVAPPFGEATFNIMFRDEYGGIDPFASVAEAGFELDMFGTSKGWYEWNEKKYRLADFIELLEGDAELWKTVVDTYMSLA